MERSKAHKELATIFFRELRIFCERVPTFVPDEEYVADALSYLVYSDLYRFLCESAKCSRWNDIEEAALLTERLLSYDKDEVRDLVGDFLQGIAECSESKAIFQKFGPKAVALQARNAAWPT